MSTKSPVSRLVLWLPLLAAAFYIGYTWRTAGLAPVLPASAAPRTPGDAQLRPFETETIELFRNASPSVVFITTLERRRIGFSRMVTEIPSGNGSGFVWDRDGNIVTNYHVVQGALRGGSLRVTLADHSEWDAEIRGIAPEKDLAVLHIEAPAAQLPAITIGASRDLQVGQAVYAIGNPFGLDHTLTTGVISALGREIQSLADQRNIRNVIQTDAAINPGNSGGPLLDSSGRLIGVNTQIYSTSGSSAGIGFSIPVDTVNWVVPDLIAHGGIDRPTLGLERYDDTYPRRLGTPGVLVIDVAPGTGAARAGLRGTEVARQGEVRLGDIITAIGEEEVRNFDDLMQILEKYEAGDRVDLTALRDGKPTKLTIELGESTLRRSGRGR